ncbi:hypothetical protein LINGRAHAP2_LOCUS15173 [Linum grandiflorum]
MAEAIILTTTTISTVIHSTSMMVSANDLI